ncbi:hypothetical protein [Novosphingobium sp.]|uniref:hypothetical protein n=1 Tax=Novosphingobium sp. TaxID=1874826 RepID=UPI0033406FB1
MTRSLFDHAIPNRAGTALLTGLALMLGACGGVPSGQVQAHVNGHEISDRAVAAELAAANLPDSDKAMQHAALDKIIARYLIIEEAQRQGLDKSPDYLAFKDRAQDLVLADMMVKRWAAALPRPAQADIDHYVAANPLRFDARAFLLVDAIEAPNASGSIKDLAPLHAMDAVESTLRARHLATRRASQVLDTALIDPAMARQLTSAPVGEPIVFAGSSRSPNSGLRVLAVMRSDPAPIPADLRNGLAADAVRQAQIAQKLAGLKEGARIAFRADLQPGPQATK